MNTYNFSHLRIVLPGIIICLSSLFSFAQNLVPEPTIDRPPNIILVLVDDMGTEALGCYGGTSYATPVIDKMAESGVRFNHAYAYPLCTPTRVSIMTGKYNFRNWKAFGILDPEEKTFGHYLQSEGYRTCMVGKWQLQSYDPPGYPGGDLRRNTGMKVEHAGFDEYCMWHTGHTEDKGSRYSDPVIYQNGSFLNNTHGKYGPDIFTDYLLDFIERYQDEPFFVYYPMALTHDPFLPTPDSEEWSDPTKRMKKDSKYFGAMVSYTDKLMGRILGKLEEWDLSKETLVLFYTDNGTHWGISSKVGELVVQGGKRKEMDAGTRVPLIVHWPGKVSPGLVSETMVAPPDFLPTMFEAIQRPFPREIGTDGESFLSALKGPVPGRRNWVFIDHDPRPGWDKEKFIRKVFVRGPRYKLYENGRFFDPEKDPLEKYPIQPETQEQEKLFTKYQMILDSLTRYRTFGYLEKLDSSFDWIVPPHAKIEVIAEGFTWSEGPVWLPQEACLLFSDVPRNVIYKWTDAYGIETFLKPSGYTGDKPRKGGKGTNGLAVDQKGRLLLCRHGDREVARLASSFKQPIPVFESLATHYQGNKLNSPNDLVCDKSGNIFFTDPPYGLDRSDPNGKELKVNGVYRINKEGALSLLTGSLERPNGIGLSPDEKTLYVANSDPPQFIAYDLHADGSVTNERILFDASELHRKSISKQAPDGMVVNDQGIIFAAGPDGVLVLSPEGKHLGTIRTNKKTSNCDLNEDQTVLFITCDDYILRVRLEFKSGFE
jgi:sugar lactone lactonase YvrE/arylsulfatase A-like enzyme